MHKAADKEIYRELIDVNKTSFSNKQRHNFLQYRENKEIYTYSRASALGWGLIGSYIIETVLSYL